jgi:hypothetical protein
MIDGALVRTEEQPSTGDSLGDWETVSHTRPTWCLLDGSFGSPLAMYFFTASLAVAVAIAVVSKNQPWGKV